MSVGMKRFAALVLLLGFAAACGTTQPDPKDMPMWVGTVPHALQLKKVDDGSPYMKELVDHVDPGRGLIARVDHWKTPDGQTLDEPYLEGSRTALDTYLAAHAPPTGEEVALSNEGDGHWRTHLVLAPTELDDGAVAKAELGKDAQTDRDIVRLTFTPAAARTFDDLTSHMVGHKLAVIVDGTVISAPVIMGAIRGGAAEVTFANQAQAQSFAATFGGV